MTRLELTGKRFGSLVVLGFSHLNNRKVSYWRCRCDCGVPPSQYITLYKGLKKNGISCRYLYNGIDRINNEIEYTIRKCVPCCKYCNYMKRSLPKDNFLEQMKKIYSHSCLKTV